MLSYWNYDKLCRVRLSKSFYFRDFIASEIASYYGITNIPENPDIAVKMGKKLAEELLEPLQDHFGRIHVRSAYRSPTLNDFCSRKGLGCKSNPKNYARHIWDFPDAEGLYGAMACIVIPAFQEEYERTGDMSPVADWISNNLTYSELIFFKKMGTFNIGWHQNPKKHIDMSRTLNNRQAKLF